MILIIDINRSVMDLENDKIYNYKVKIEVKDVVLVLNDKIVNENEDIRI